MLESILSPESRSESGTLIREGDSLHRLFIIRDGEVLVRQSGKDVATLGRGDIAGSIADLYNRRPSQYEFIYKGDISLYVIKSEDFITFLEKNPGLIMKLNYDF
jgi:CRP-like cAMP-binding protein